jgi:hypothetical protein
LYQYLEVCKTLEKGPALFQERNHFPYGAARTEIVAQFVEGTTEAYRRFNGSKTTHWIVSLFDATMILLQPIIQILTRSMLNIAAHRLSYSSWIGRMTIRRHLVGSMANHSNCLLEKLLGCLHIPLLAQHGIHQIAIVIDRPIKVAPLSVNLDVGFIHVPRSPRLTSSFDPQLLCHQGSKTSFPVSNGLMGKHKTPLQEHLSNIPQA